MQKLRLLALCALAPVLLSACGQAAGEESSTEAPRPAGEFAGVSLTWTMLAANDGAEGRDLIAMVRDRTGIEIDVRIVPETADGQLDNALVALLAGDEMDIVYYAAPRLKPLINAGVLEPLDGLAATRGYDMEAVFGDYLAVSGGKTWGLPAFSDIWLTLYNKAVFDNAGVPYPQADNWTWDAYVETARLLTDAEAGVYGSLMLDYNCYNYMLAQQRAVPHYKADGSSNYDHPAFREALAFFYGLGNEEKIQPAIAEFDAGNVPWDAFFTQEAEYGMFVCGGWTLQNLAEREEYPRDWQFGVLPMPYPAGEKPSTLTLPGCYAVPVTSGNKEAAFAAIACMAEDQYTLGYGRIPARRDLPREVADQYIREELVLPYEADGLTVEDLHIAWFDPARTAYPEKVSGPADTELDLIWVEEGRAYGLGQKSLDDAMRSIRERADEAISGAQ